MTVANSSFLAHSNPKVHSTGRGTHWEFFSVRNRTRVIGGSSLEFDHYVLTEMDPTVLEWTPQVEVEVKLDGKVRRRILDSKVVYRGGRLVVNEVKPEEYAAHPETLKQMKVQDAWAQANEADSKLVTEKSIRANEILLENCHKMLPWQAGMHGVDEALARLVLGVVAGRPKPIAVQDIATELHVRADTFIPVLIKFYLEGQLALDVATRRFGLGTMVSIQTAF